MAIYPSVYNTPYPVYSPQQPIQQIPQYQPQQSDNGIIWVQGEAGAKAYPIQSGKSVVLFDSETERFFIKSTDASGMPQPLRIFKYSETDENEEKSNKIDISQFITRDEFEDLMEKIEKIEKVQKNLRKDEQKNAKPSI